MAGEFRATFPPFRLHCLLVGHDDRLARAPNRLFLICDRCARRTNGWVIGKPPVVIRPPTRLESVGRYLRPVTSRAA